MTSKKHWTLRAAGLLFALVLITSCFVGGTFAKYVKSVSGTQMARVARFGVEITAEDETAFNTTYATGASGVSVGLNSVISSDSHKVVAPGTKEDDTVIFSITGTPEVAVHVELAMEGIMEVFLKNGTYLDLTTPNPDDEFILAKPYHPVVFTLKQNDALLASGTISEINTKLGALPKDYKAGTDLGAEFGTYTLSWEWAFADPTIDKKDQADTLLGALAAKPSAFSSYALGTDYQTGISFTLTATVTQID